MPSSLFDMLSSQLGGSELEQISAQLGADKAKTATAMNGALGALLGALAKNAQSGDGAAALAGALERDNHGAVLDRLGDHIKNPQAGNGDGILKHVLGGKRGAIERGLSAATGVDEKQAGSLLSMLAPVVLGALGKAKQQKNLGANDLASMLGQERDQMAKQQPAAAGMLGQLLDTDGDGDLDIKDMARHGKGLLGRLFNR